MHSAEFKTTELSKMHIKVRHGYSAAVYIEQGLEQPRIAAYLREEWSQVGELLNILARPYLHEVTGALHSRHDGHDRRVQSSECAWACRFGSRTPRALPRSGLACKAI